MDITLNQQMGGGSLRNKDCTRTEGGRHVCQVGRVNTSQDGVVVSRDGLSPCHTAGHGNEPKIIEYETDTFQSGTGWNEQDDKG